MIMEKRKDKIITGIVFATAISLFYLLFTRLILKSDDGNFLGVVSKTDFLLFEWLSERYRTISGRSICELLTAVFLILPPLCWKVLSSILWVVFFFIVCKLSEAFGKSDRNTCIFVACLPFVVMVSCLNPAVFWFSGSFTYMIPFQCFLIACSPMFFCLSDIKCPPVLAAFSCPAALVACSQEQSAALMVTFSVVFLALLLRQKKVRFYHFLSFIAGVTEAGFLFSAPGMRKRGAVEALAFQRFSKMSILEKILCGVSNWFAFEYLMSFAVFGLFICLLIILLRQEEKSVFDRRLSYLLAVSSSLVCFGLNAVYVLLRKKLPDKGFEDAFQSGKFHVTDILLMSACFIVSAEIVLALFRLIAEKKRIGIAVSLCFGAAVCSGTVLGFSSSVYASGQRVFFFSEMLILLACVILFSGLKNDRLKLTIRNSVLVFAFLIYMTECLTFFFIETPIMG